MARAAVEPVVGAGTSVPGVPTSRRLAAVERRADLFAGAVGAFWFAVAEVVRFGFIGP